MALDKGTEHSGKGEMLVNSGRGERVRLGQVEKGCGEGKPAKLAKAKR